MLSSACDRSATVNNSKVGTAVVAVSAWVGNLFLLPPCFPTFLSFFRNFGFAEITVHSEKFKYIWLFSRFFVTLASPNLLSLDNKNKKSVFCFVLFSLIRNFAV